VGDRKTAKQGAASCSSIQAYLVYEYQVDASWMVASFLGKRMCFQVHDFRNQRLILLDRHPEIKRMRFL
jgi:hypothetical protein